MKVTRVGSLALLSAALLAVSSVVAVSAGRSPEASPQERPAAVSDFDGRRANPVACARGTVGCQLPVPEPGCEPVIGEPCLEEFADAALMRWLRDDDPMPGERAVLEVVDGRLLVVGYAHGYGEPDLDVEVVERENHVSITLRFNFHQEPSLDGNDVQPPVIGFGRVLVELDDRLGDRPVDVWTSYTPGLGASGARD